MNTNEGTKLNPNNRGSQEMEMNRW
jgi:hypothetical protein